MNTDSSPMTSCSTHHETITSTSEQLSEKQLREIYDNEEIERFLRLFAKYVTEVRAPGTARNAGEEEEQTELESEWLGPSDTSSTTFSATPKSSASNEHNPNHLSLSDEIVKKLLPCLPATRTPPQPFTFNRFRLAVQRLYFTLATAYTPFVVRICRLAQWHDKKKSLFYCTLFWILWWNDLVMAACIFRLLVALFHRRLFPYPSLVELEKYRKEVSNADAFGEKLTERLSVTSAIGPREIWRLCRLSMPSSNKPKTNGKAGKAQEPASEQPQDMKKNEATILEDPSDSTEVQDMKRLVLFVMNEIADFHERVKNLFIWRKPSSSKVHGLVWVLAVLFGVVLCTPTKYLCKGTLCVLGFMYWHITPIIAAIPPKDRLRLPPALSDVPTDAEYAMEIISQRVAAGLEINPSQKVSKPRQKSHETLVSETSNNSPPNPRGQKATQSSNPAWKKVGGALESGLSFMQEGKRLLYDKELPGSSSDPISSQRVFAAQSSNSHTFPAQHSSYPGLITLTPQTLIFTSLTSLTPKLTIPLESITGVKKTSLLKGMDIQWADSTSNDQVGRSERFLWVGGRDELFARLVSMNTTKWVR